MENIYIEKEVRMCYYRHCDVLIPENRRSDAKSCCDEHGWKERNLQKKDNLIKNSIQKALDNNYKVIKDLFERGKYEVPKHVLRFMDFEFECITTLGTMNFDTGVITCNVYEYQLTIANNICTIKKL